MKEEIIEQSCSNCKYFVQHYRKETTFFNKINCGHCINYKVKHDKRKNLPYLNGCDKWEAVEEANHEKINNAIFVEVNRLNNRVEALISILSEELQEE